MSVQIPLNSITVPHLTSGTPVHVASSLTNARTTRTGNGDTVFTLSSPIVYSGVAANTPATTPPATGTTPQTHTTATPTTTTTPTSTATPTSNATPTSTATPEVHDCDAMDHSTKSGDTGTATGGGGKATGGGDTPFSFGLGLGTRSFNMGRPLTYRVGGATFSFPPVGKSNMSTSAPKISWGKGWTAKGGGTFEHTSGAVAKVSKQTRISLADPSKGSVVSTPYGRGVKLPDGSVTGVDRKGRAYVLASGGELRYLKPGIQSIGSMQIRVFSATTIDVTSADGRNVRYDSRGNVRVRGGASAIGGGGSGALKGVDTLKPETGKLSPPATTTPKSGTSTPKGGGTRSIDTVMNDAMSLIREIMTMLQTGDNGTAAGGGPTKSGTATGGGGLGGLFSSLLGGGGGLGGLDQIFGGLDQL